MPEPVLEEAQEPVLPEVAVERLVLTLELVAAEEPQVQFHQRDLQLDVLFQVVLQS